MSQEQTLLAFDYGTKKIGVAVGQNITATSTPLETVCCVKEQPNWSAIAQLINTWKPQGLVVGIPYNMDGSENPMTAAAFRFARRLSGRYKLPVHHVDERLSSVEAQQILQSSATSNIKKIKRGDIDKVAAHLILQTYFSGTIINSD